MEADILIKIMQEIEGNHFFYFIILLAIIFREQVAKLPMLKRWTNNEKYDELKRHIEGIKERLMTMEQVNKKFREDVRKILNIDKKK